MGKESIFSFRQTFRLTENQTLYEWTWAWTKLSPYVMMNHCNSHNRNIAKRILHFAQTTTLLSMRVVFCWKRNLPKSEMKTAKLKSHNTEREMFNIEMAQWHFPFEVGS